MDIYQDDSSKYYDVIVIGAGIAGLTAAYKLVKANKKVLVLEKANRVGGRIFTDSLDDFTYDVTCQFIAEYFYQTFDLIYELGIEQELERFKNIMLIENNGKFKVSKMETVIGKTFPPWLTIKDRLKLANLAIDVFKNRHKLSFQEIEKCVDFDNYTIEEYALKRLNPQILEKLVSPLLSSVYFMYPSEISFPLYLVLLSNVLKTNLYTFRNGMKTLPEALAANVSVKLSQQVTKTIRGHAGWTIITDNDHGKSQVWQAAKVIIATPSNEALMIADQCQLPTIQRQFLHKQKYSFTYGLITALNHRLTTDAYCMLISKTGKSKIASICFQEKKCVSYAPQGFSVHAIYTHRYFAEEIMHLPENQKKELILKEVEKIFPNYRQHVTWSKLYSIPYGLPYSYLNKAKEVLAFQNEQKQNANTGLYFCGDYLNWPSIEGAVVSGQKAAKLLLATN